MLLELCDMTLKDWLADNSTVTTDMLEDISIFVLNVARAVEFLHSQQVISVYFHTFIQTCARAAAISAEIYFCMVIDSTTIAFNKMFSQYKRSYNFNTSPSSFRGNCLYYSLTVPLLGYAAYCYRCRT